MLELVKYIKEHGLPKTLEDYKLKSKDYGHKVIVKYDQIASMMGERVVQESRGIVLEKDTWKVLSMGFTKFFNSAEGHAAKIDWSTAHILEKLDGSFITVYWDWVKEKWFASTTGTAEAEGEVNNKSGTTFSDLFWDTVHNKYNFNECLLDKEHTYMFELTTPYNIVVKPHGESSATLLSVRNLKTLKEVSYNDLKMISESIGVPLVKAYDLNGGNVGELIRTFEDMPWFDEGYVVVDVNHNRIKIKNPAYVSAHHLKGKMGNHHIMGIIKSNECDEFIATFPDRKDEIIKLKVGYDDLISRLEDAWDELKTRRPKNITAGEKKKFAMAVFEVAERLDLKSFTGLYFSLNDGSVDSVKQYMLNYDNKRLYKLL